ncbi:MAG: zf-HC2 domain-containing protein [Deltaproteobacteria bacterium]|jgi:hypothetical protein|nr:zf-HC2 domain-containing protein [Deltaproteobacteria bacterium]
MKCRQVRKKLSAYIDDELDSAVSHSIARHLSQCPLCQKKLNVFLNVNTVLKDLPWREVAPGFAERLILKAQRPHTPVKEPDFICRIFGPLLSFFKNFYELIDPPKPSRTQTLEEFSDFPPFCIGYIYFKEWGRNNFPK